MGTRIGSVVAVAAVAAGVALGPLAAVGSAHRRAKPKIEATEAGYFGSATVTRRLSVFVYSNLGPATGTHVTVCLDGTCKRAHGHNARLAWYSVSFRLHRGLHMGDRVRFSATASDVAGSSHVHATDRLLCMHNNGSTPQG